MNFQPEGIDKIENLKEDDEFACGKQKIAKSCKKKKIAIVPFENQRKLRKKVFCLWTGNF